MDKKKTSKISPQKLIKKKKQAREKRTKKIIEDIKKEIEIDLDKVNYNLKSDRIDEEQDKDCYLNTDILKNELGIRDKEHLIQVERRIVMLQMYILRERMRNIFLEYDYGRDEEKIFAFKKEYLKKIIDFENYLFIHKKMFGELYPFAGKLRDVNISKDTFVFAGYVYIKDQGEMLFSNMKKDFEDILIRNEEIEKRNKVKFKQKNISEEKKKMKIELAKSIAKYLADLNVLHPFREGNGRTTREIFRQIAYVFGYILTLKNIPTEEFLNAMKKSVYNYEDLEKILYRSLYER